MAVDMFIKIGDIKGESLDHAHKDWIDVLAWSWGESNSGISFGREPGKVAIEDLAFTKYVDKSSPDLMLFCASGKHFKEAVLVVRKAGEKAVPFINVKLTDVIVTSYHTGGSGGEDALTENVTLNFTRIDFGYTETNPDGSPGETRTAIWNVAKNRGRLDG